MFERFTDRSRKVMALASQEAQRLNHEYSGTEHLLLGLIKEGSGVGANALKNLGVDLNTVRISAEKMIKPGPDMVAMGKLPQTLRAKVVIQNAIKESHRLHHNYIGTEHLLLGLLAEHEGVAAQVLAHHGVTLEEARAQVQYLLGMADGDAASVHTVNVTSTWRPPPVSNMQLNIQAMELAAAEAQNLGHKQVGPEHLLLGLLRINDPHLVEIFAGYGMNLEQVRQQVQQLHRPDPPAASG